jgi:Na+-transporting NADH:ubiquinone oxidoreductase subunit NqrC
MELSINPNTIQKAYAVLEQEESPGFGANCVNEDIRQQFLGITNADQLDGITGATITTTALKNSTQAAIDLVKLLEGGEAV